MADICKCWHIYQAGQLIGTAQLQWLDETTGVQGGDFLPAPGYSAVQAIFKRFVMAQTPEQFASYYAQRDALQLRIRDETATPVPGLAHILDLTETAPEMPLEIEIYLTHVPHTNDSSQP